MASSDKPVIVQGIKINMTSDELDDFEITELLVDMNSDDGMLQMQAIVGLLRFLFKGEWKSVRDQLRKNNDGKLTNETVMNFFSEVMDALNSKN